MQGLVQPQQNPWIAGTFKWVKSRNRIIGEDCRLEGIKVDNDGELEHQFAHEKARGEISTPFWAPKAVL